MISYSSTQQDNQISDCASNLVLPAVSNPCGSLLSRMEYMSPSLRLVLAIMCKHEVIHKSRSKHRIATSPENRATATGKVNVNKHF